MAAIDLSSDAPVLEYVEGERAPSGVPARDLSGGDLSRLAYVEMLAAADQEAEGFTRPTPTPADAARVADALIQTGAFRAVTAAKPSKKSTEAAADPAPAPESAPDPVTTPPPADPAPSTGG